MRTKWQSVVVLLSLFAAGVSCKPDSDGSFLKQGWSREQRQDFYHKSQGTRLIPLPWLLALTQKGGTEPFLADANVVRFRFIPDPKHKFNEHGLPVGFAVTQFPSEDDPSKMVPWVGYTCAACHTGRIVANGKTVQIDGAPSMQNNAAFVRAMLESLNETMTDNQKLEAFAKNALGIPAPGPEHKEALKDKATRLIDRIAMKSALKEARTKCGAPAMKRKYADLNFMPTPNWGFGRLDAIGRASNTVFAGFGRRGEPPWHPCNLDTADAPVSIPKIWNAWKYDWVQWNAFVENPLARNLAQALALGADPTTIDLTSLGWLENHVEALQPPHWEDVFGAADAKLVEEGKALYHKGHPDRPVKGGLCAHCHVPESRLLKDCDGKAQWTVAMVPVDEIGTDEVAAVNYTTRLKKPIAGLGLPDPFQPAIAMATITSKVITDRLKAQAIPEPDRKHLQRCRTNKWLNAREYKAPTHEGVWVTAPYLHNGSVPNLSLVLSPKEERDKQAKMFCVGHDLTYDSANVGFKLTDQCPEEFKFDTTLRNNNNKGHEFRNAKDCEKREGHYGENGVLGCELSDHERKALVEYLKTL
jgi:hypothetical protein